MAGTSSSGPSFLGNDIVQAVRHIQTSSEPLLHEKDIRQAVRHAASSLKEGSVWYVDSSMKVAAVHHLLLHTSIRPSCVKIVCSQLHDAKLVELGSIFTGKKLYEVELLEIGSQLDSSDIPSMHGIVPASFRIDSLLQHNSW